MEVFITGGANGIGRATAEQLIDNGHTVTVYDHDEDAVADLPNTIEGITGDVRDPEAVTAALEDRDFDVLINCAGYQALGALEDLSIETLEQTFETNVIGLWRVTQDALPMLREREGRIINVSSLAGRVSVPFWGAYTGSKHAVEAISDALRGELAPENVDVVIIEPGPITTGFNERGREHLRTFLPDTPYAERYRRILEEGGMDGVPADAAARTIVTAVETDRPKPRYTITWQAWVFPKLRAWLPDRLWDKLVEYY